MLGDGSPWQRSFEGGDYAVFRLTPEKYHYTHSPVSGRVLDIYSVEGRYYPCNPNAAVQLMTPVSKNRRVVTILDTDCPNGSAVGRVAMIEVVALMIGQIEQRYSEHRYENPRAVEKGMFLRAGAPKALFRPGSSTVVLLFQRDRIRFAGDLVENQHRSGVQNRFSLTLGEPLTETDVAVRSLLATAGRGGTMLNVSLRRRSRSRLVRAAALGRTHASRRALADAGGGAHREIGRRFVARLEPHLLRLLQRDRNRIRLRDHAAVAGVGRNSRGRSVLRSCCSVLVCVPSSRLIAGHCGAQA